MLCLVIMGVLPSNIITVEAAHCSHTNFGIAYNVYKEEYHDAYYHYIISGTQYCCSCGFTKWENLTTSRKKHTWRTKTETISGVKAEITYCIECNFVQ